MSPNEHQRLQLLEQTIRIMQTEFTGVLKEFQVLMEGTVKTYSMAIKMLDDRVTKLEQTNPTQIRHEDVGKEL